jgi:putative MFS transporter
MPLPAAEHSPLRMNKKISWKGYSSLLFSTTTTTTTTERDLDDDDDASPSMMELSHPRRRQQQHQQQQHDENDDDDYVFPDVPSHENPNDGPEPAESTITTTTTTAPLLLDVEDAIDRLGMGPFQYLVVLACGLCFAADAMEILLLSFLAVILRAEWDLTERQVDSIISVVFAGAMLGTLVLSTLGDAWGRRPVFGLTAVLISIFGVATAFCTTYEQVVLARFLVGFGVGGLTVPYDALSEFMPTSYRGTNLLSTSFFWTGGSLLVPFFAWLTLDGSGSGAGSWRAFVALCALPCIVSTVLGICLVPESPRWLLTRGKEEKAMRILRRAAAKNGRDPYLTFPAETKLIDHAAAKKVKRSSMAESTMERNHEEEETSKSPHAYQAKKNASCSTLCTNPQWRKIMVLLSGQWYGLAFMYYGAIMAVSIVFSDESSSLSNAAAMNATTASELSSENESREYAFDYSAIFISSSAETIGLTIAILTVDRFGRVPTQVWTYFLGGLCILILGLLDFYVGRNASDEAADSVDAENTSTTEQQQKRRYLIFFAFLSRMFIMAATSITWLHTSELLPTEIRATGHGFANAMGRIGGITSPFIISKSTSLRTIGIVMCLISTFTAVFSRCLPETAGRAMGDLDSDPEIETSQRPRVSAAAGPASCGHGHVVTDDGSFEGDDSVGTEKDVSSFELL